MYFYIRTHAHRHGHRGIKEGSEPQKTFLGKEACEMVVSLCIRRRRRWKKQQHRSAAQLDDANHLWLSSHLVILVARYLLPVASLLSLTVSLLLFDATLTNESAHRRWSQMCVLATAPAVKRTGSSSSRSFIQPLPHEEEVVPSRGVENCKRNSREPEAFLSV